MAETSYTIGADASCTDGAYGEGNSRGRGSVARTVTHLLVEPKHEHKQGRLVPVDLVDTVAGGIRMRCTRAELEKLDPAEETEFRTGSGHPATWVMAQSRC